MAAAAFCDISGVSGQAGTGRAPGTVSPSGGVGGMSDRGHLLIFGLGYSARAVAALAVREGYAVTGTSRRDGAEPPAGVGLVRPEAAAALLAQATHWLASAPPGEEGDPILALLGPAMRQRAAALDRLLLHHRRLWRPRRRLGRRAHPAGADRAARPPPSRRRT